MVLALETSQRECKAVSACSMQQGPLAGSPVLGGVRHPREEAKSTWLWSSQFILSFLIFCHHVLQTGNRKKMVGKGTREADGGGAIDGQTGGPSSTPPSSPNDSSGCLRSGRSE